MRGFAEKVVFVTGSGRGIGRAIALRLAADGARVAVADLDGASAARTAEEIGKSAVALSIDVVDSASVRAAVAEAEKRLGPIHVLVNNAGWDKVEPFVKSEESTWDRVLAINLKGPIICARAVLDGMIERRAGRIVSLGSDAGRVGSTGEAVYSAAKAGVRRSLARSPATGSA
jgi:2-hydroxycyclohexanecarboxyl-CoA dehydrogenase